MKETLIYLSHLDHEDTEQQVFFNWNSCCHISILDLSISKEPKFFFSCGLVMIC